MNLWRCLFQTQTIHTCQKKRHWCNSPFKNSSYVLFRVLYLHSNKLTNLEFLRYIRSGCSVTLLETIIFPNLLLLKCIQNASFKKMYFFNRWRNVQKCNFLWTKSIPILYIMYHTFSWQFCEYARRWDLELLLDLVLKGHIHKIYWNSYFFIQQSPLEVPLEAPQKD